MEGSDYNNSIVRVLNTTGERVAEFRSSNTKDIINVSNLDTGIYIVEFVVDDNRYYKRVVVSN